MDFNSLKVRIKLLLPYPLCAQRHALSPFLSVPSTPPPAAAAVPTVLRVRGAPEPLQLAYMGAGLT